MRRFWVHRLAISLALLSTAPAFAGEVHQYLECNKQPSETEVQGAKGAFQAGMASYGEADYERAILYWEDAFRRDCTATLLLQHLGRAYEGQGNLEQAIVALRTYLLRSPDATDRPQVEKRVDVFEQKLEDERKRNEEKRAQQEEAARRALAPKAPEPTTNQKNLYVNPIIPIAVGSVGLAAAIVGTLIYFPARSDLKKAEDDCPKRNDCPSSVVRAGNDARSKVNWGGAVTITGLLIAGGGTGWYFFNESQAPKQKPATASIQPWVGTTSAGVFWQGEF
jgi:tetratricopeptide (TPR) repeat protein